MSVASKPGSKCTSVGTSPTVMDLLGKVIHLSGSHRESNLGIDRFYIPVEAEGTAVQYLAITLTPVLGADIRSPVHIKSRVETGCLSPSSFSGHHYIPGVAGRIE
jgi:hypothetical protein